MNEGLTYGRLYAKLRELGFRQREAESDGKPGWLFEHPKSPAALIVLPRRPPEQPVERLYQGSVLTTLRVHDLLPEKNPLVT
jgi:hypothetical protein